MEWSSRVLSLFCRFCIYTTIYNSPHVSILLRCFSFCSSLKSGNESQFLMQHVRKQHSQKLFWRLKQRRRMLQNFPGRPHPKCLQALHLSVSKLATLISFQHPKIQILVNTVWIALLFMSTHWFYCFEEMLLTNFTQIMNQSDRCTGSTLDQLWPGHRPAGHLGTLHLYAVWRSSIHHSGPTSVCFWAPLFQDQCFHINQRCTSKVWCVGTSMCVHVPLV